MMAHVANFKKVKVKSKGNSPGGNSDNQWECAFHHRGVCIIVSVIPVSRETTGLIIRPLMQ